MDHLNRRTLLKAGAVASLGSCAGGLSADDRRASMIADENRKPGATDVTQTVRMLPGRVLK